MSNDLVAMWLAVVMGISLVAMPMGWWLVHTHFWHSQKKLFQIGFVLAGLGLCVQTYRSLYYFQFGTYPLDFFFPTWAVKDIGFCMMTFSKFQEAKQYREPCDTPPVVSETQEA